MKLRRLLICSAAALGFCAVSASADYKKNFVEGYKAFKKERWQDVDRLMVAAIEENSTNGALDVSLGGTFQTPYIPHYYLGLARSKMGRCEEALAAWSVFSASAQVRSLKEYKALAEERRPCESQYVAERASAVEKSLAELKRRLTEVQGRPERKALADRWNSDATLAPAEARAVELIEQFEQELVGAREQGNVDLLNRVSAGISALRPRLDSLESAMIQAASEKPPASIAPSVAQAALPELAPRVSASPLSPTAVSSELYRLATLFFAGDYERLLATSSGFEPRVQAERLQLWLFEAAAHHALAALDPGSAQKHIATASLQVKAIKRANAQFAPSGRYFCPAFVKFWNQVI